MDAALSADRRDRFAASLATLAPAGRLGIAVSGGPDSLALLLLANSVRTGDVAAATVDHGLRPEAAAEAAMVAALCDRLAIPHTVLRVTVTDDPEGPQASARRARYDALKTWADREELPFLATAHHADDQAETVLMRLARGAGLTGLSGIRERRPLGDGTRTLLVRPLLDWTKAELEAIVSEAGLTPARDPSNADPRYDRTRARALLTGGWPEAARVAASAHHLAEAEAALSWAVIRLAEERLTVADDMATIDGCDLPRELRRRLLLAAFAELAPALGLRGDSVDRLLHALDRGKVATLGGFRCDPGPPWRVSRAAARRSG